MAKMLLPAEAWLINRSREDAADSLRGDLRCPCGCETFRIRHSGRQARPLLGLFSVTNWIRPAGGPLVIDACCTACGKAIPLHCSERNGDGWLLPANPEMTELEHPRLRDQRVRVNLWYCWDDAPEMVDGHFAATYTLFSLAVRADGHPKEICLYEQA